MSYSLVRELSWKSDENTVAAARRQKVSGLAGDSASPEDGSICRASWIVGKMRVDRAFYTCQGPFASILQRFSSI